MLPMAGMIVMVITFCKRNSKMMNQAWVTFRSFLTVWQVDLEFLIGYPADNF